MEPIVAEEHSFFIKSTFKPDLMEVREKDYAREKSKKLLDFNR